MRAVLSLACLFVLTAGCGDSPIMLVDGGPRTDTGGGGGTDAGGGGGTDAGGGGGTDAPTGPTLCGSANGAMFEELPATCLPRCSSATFTAVAGCMGATAQMCQQSAVMADRTVAALVNLGGAAPETVNCATCFNYQIQTCVFDSCPDEVNAVNACAATDPATATTRCATEISAANTCSMTNMAAVQACVNGRAVGCFAR